MKAVSLVALSIASFVGVTACSSSTPKSAQGTSSSTVGDKGSLPTGSAGSATDVSAAPLPPSKACVAFLAAMDGAFTGDRATLASLPAAFDVLSKSAPAELKADFAVVSATYAKLAEIVKKAGGDPAKYAKDPVALALFADAKFTAAIPRVTAYTDKNCPKK